MTRIWDTFPFCGELDMLECRLRHLDGQVYRHVIAEAEVTYSGQPRALTFPDARERFAPWADKIIYLPVRADQLPQGIDPPCVSPVPLTDMCERAWARERAQRDALMRGVGSTGDDLVMVGDLDEIPDPPVLAALRAKPPAKPVVLAMRVAVFAVDWLHPRLGLDTVIARPGQVGPFGSGLRYWKHSSPRINGGGWHFSWMGGPDAIARKAAAHAHLEVSDAILQANADGRLYERGWSPWDETRLIPIDTSATWPDWIASRECPAAWFRPRLGHMILVKSPCQGWDEHF